MPDTISPLLERQAAQHLIRLARREATATSSRHTKDRMLRTIAELETALSSACPRCKGVRFLPNPAWKNFALSLPANLEASRFPRTVDELRDLEVPAEYTAAMHLYEQAHGPSVIPCPACNSEAAAAVLAQTRRAA